MGGGGGGGNRVEESPHEKELARIAAEQFGRHEEIFKPVEDAFIEDVQSIGESDETIAAGMTTADTARSTDQAIGEATGRELAAGASPGSGRFNEAVTDTTRAGAKARGLGVASARRGTENRRLAGQMAAVDVGLGRQAEGIQGISDVARRAHEDAVEDARRESLADARNERAAGTIIGFGAKKYQKSGNDHSGSPVGVGAATSRRFRGRT